ncbi:MAG: hypothetical protein Q4A18_03795 [Rikenellaceae bacterium]|nr:hypothetical protein [Rikenellaceae bacterium]
MMRKLTLLVLLLITASTLWAQPIATDTTDTAAMSLRRRARTFDRELKLGNTFGYRGEWAIGLTASYGTISSEDSDMWVYLSNMNIDGALTTIKPFFGYFYRDNRMVGSRLGYQYLDGNLGSLDLDLGEQNDITLNIDGMQLSNQSFSFSIFHRNYVAIDRNGHFGLFAEVEGSMEFGSGEFVNASGETPKYTESKTMKFKLGFNPGMAIYIFPSVCATVSLGLGGIQYTSVEQFDEAGNKIGSRRASKMRFRLNVADINFGMTFHLWNKKKMDSR